MCHIMGAIKFEELAYKVTDMLFICACGFANAMHSIQRGSLAECGEQPQSHSLDIASLLLYCICSTCSSVQALSAGLLDM